MVNLGFLGFFKYYNFFIDNFTEAFSFFGQNVNINSLNIVLPVGISFYTFQTLSYSIDVYRGKMKPTTNFIAFSAFVSFFPQLVAGPIERATHLLPQFYKQRSFNYHKAVDGLRQILWGLFKKWLLLTMQHNLPILFSITLLIIQAAHCFWVRYSLLSRYIVTFRVTLILQLEHRAFLVST